MRHIAPTIILLILLLSSCTRSASLNSTSVIDAVNGPPVAGFAQVTEPRPFVFPDDLGPQPEYQTEWWYFTGNLSAPNGDHFGYHLTFFRRGLTPGIAERKSAWGTNQVYMAHMAITDVARERFVHFERFSRGGAGLAGATSNPFRVFLDDWSVAALDATGSQLQLIAGEGDATLNLRLASTKPPALQGEQGFSQKGREVGNASYYYSFTRMATTGTLQIDGVQYAVTGDSWMDREFGTSALEAGAQGWDWFSLQLDNQSELMLFQIRHADPALVQYEAMLIAPDGSTRRLATDTMQITVQATWRSPHTGISYPSGWQISLPDEQISLTLTPHVRDQEMTTSIVYWEGAIRIEGTWAGQPVRGNGYVELTGYDGVRQTRG